MTTLQLLSPGKLNLHLEVLQRREDGFHDLETLMTTVSIYDSIKFSHNTKKPFELNCRWANGYVAEQAASIRNSGESGDLKDALGDLPSTEDNLIYRAADLLKQEALTTELSAESSALIKQNVRIDVVKRIPSGGGMGGASSNAATTLVGLNRFWKLGWSQDQLSSIAARLGSDVPFFIYGKTAVCRGRGELVSPVHASRSTHMVVVRPLQSLSTPAVFGELRVSDYERKSIKPILNCYKSGQLSALAKSLFNRLEQAAANLCAWIEVLRNEFRALGCPGHQLTGSGSCYFGVCHNRLGALQLYHRLRQRNLGFVYLCRSNI